MPQSPKYYAERFYYDSLVYEPGYLRHLLQDFAPGQIFGGTDYPYAIMETRLHDFLSHSESAARASLFNGAARRFLGLQKG